MSTLHCRVITLVGGFFDATIKAESLSCDAYNNHEPAILAPWDDPRWCPTCLHAVKQSSTGMLVRKQPVIAP